MPDSLFKTEDAPEREMNEVCEWFRTGPVHQSRLLRAMAHLLHERNTFENIITKAHHALTLDRIPLALEILQKGLEE